MEPVEEDLFHLDHADPCYFDGVQWTKTNRQRAANLCGKLIQLYLASDYTTEGMNPDVRVQGLGLRRIWHNLVFATHEISFSYRMPKDLSKCDQDDLEGYQKRMEANQKAERNVQGMIDGQSGVTSGGNLTKRRLARKLRGGSRNPSKSSAGRSPSIFSPLFRSFRKSMRTKSQKSDTSPVG